MLVSLSVLSWAMFGICCKLDALLIENLQAVRNLLLYLQALAQCATVKKCWLKQNVRACGGLNRFLVSVRSYGAPQQDLPTLDTFLPIKLDGMHTLPIQHMMMRLLVTEARNGPHRYHGPYAHQPPPPQLHTLTSGDAQYECLDESTA